MINQEFLGVIKLITTEEIIGNILVCETEGGFIIENAFSVEEEIIETPVGEMVKVELRPWAKFAQQEIFFVDKKNTITVYEADERILKIYHKTINKYMFGTSSNKVNLNEEMGFKKKLTDARSTLEKLYKDS
jgi:hypothetical protein